MVFSSSCFRNNINKFINLIIFIILALYSLTHRNIMLLYKNVPFGCWFFIYNKKKDIFKWFTMTCCQIGKNTYVISKINSISNNILHYLYWHFKKKGIKWWNGIREVSNVICGKGTGMLIIVSSNCWTNTIKNMLVIKWCCYVFQLYVSWYWLREDKCTMW